MSSKRNNSSVLDIIDICNASWLEVSNKCQELENNYNTPFSFAKNPMLISVVIDRVFENLNLRDLKNARLVCEEWNSVASPLIRKQATVVFKKDERGPSKFRKTFRNTNTNVPFTRFRLSEVIVGSQVEFFFEKYGEDITHLHFDRLDMLIPGDDGKMKPAHTIRSSLWSECINLTELHINCRNVTKQLIHIEQLVNIKKLKLETCYVILNKDVKISPQFLHFFNVLFILDPKIPPVHCFINEGVDFRNCVDVCINQYKSNASIVDLSQDVANIRKLTLYSVQIINWGLCQWNVKNLLLDRMSLTEKITMGFRELKMHNMASDLEPDAHSTEVIDISMLPATLEKFTFHNEIKTDFISSNAVDLPRLKKLDMFISLIGKPLALPHFATCPNLVSISIKGFCSQQPTLNLDWLPKSLQKLEIENAVTITDTRINAGEPYRIKKLVLFPVMATARSHILEHIQPDVFVFFFYSWQDTWNGISNFVEQNAHLTKIFVTSSTALNMFPEQVEEIEQIKETEETASVSILKRHPRDKPLYCCFENKVKKIITREEFQAALVN